MCTVALADRAIGVRQRAARLVLVGAGDVGHGVVEAYGQGEVVKAVLDDDPLYAHARRTILGGEVPSDVWLQADGLTDPLSADEALLVAKLDSAASLRAAQRAALWLRTHGRRTTAVMAVPVAPAGTLRPRASEQALRTVGRCAEATVLVAYREPVGAVSAVEQALLDDRTAETVLLRVVTTLSDALRRPSRPEQPGQWGNRLLPAGAMAYAAWVKARPEDRGNGVAAAARDAVEQLRAACIRDVQVSVVLASVSGPARGMTANQVAAAVACQVAWPAAEFRFLPEAESIEVQRYIGLTLIVANGA